MTPSLLLTILAAAVSVNATPVVHPPSNVVRQAPPTPSAYPLDTPCGNEWQYLNFNPNDPVDMGHLNTLHDIICSGAVRAHAGFGVTSADRRDEVYKDFFADDDETKGYVVSVLSLIRGPDDPDIRIGSVVAGMVIDNLDYGKIANTGTDCDTPGGDTFAYTDTDPLDNREKIHFCDATWALPEIFDTNTCANQGQRPTEMLDAMTRVVIHEMTHYSTVGPASTLGEQIVDVLNKDDVKAYGVQRAFGLVDELQDDTPELAENNADNYAYLAQVACVSYQCTLRTDYDTFFPLTPDDYS